MKPDVRTLNKKFQLQHGQSDCGVACLASIINYYGGYHSLDEIRRLTGTTKTGTKLLGLYQAAKSLGFEAKALEAEGIDSLQELSQPAILHVILNDRLQHYVVFYGFSGEDIIIGDPARGVERWSKSRLEEVWKSKSLLKPDPNSSFKKATKSKLKYERLLSWVKEDLNILLGSLFLGVLIAIMSLSTAIFSQKLIDVILPSHDSVKLIVGLALFGFVLIAKSLLGYIRSTFLNTQSRDFNNRMIDHFFKLLLRLPKPFFDSKKVGEMIARMNDTRRIQSVVSNLVGNLLIEFLVILVSMIGIFIYSVEIGIVILGCLPIYIIILWKLNRPIINSQKQVMETYALNEGNYVDVISGISEVKRTGTMDLFHKTTTYCYRSFQESVFHLGKIRIKFNFLTEFASVLLTLCVISFSAYFVLHQQLLLGTMVAILTLSGTIGPSLARIALFNIQLQEAKVAFNRMEEFTGIEPEKDHGTSLTTVSSLQLKNLSFNFPGSISLLDSINMNVEQGQLVSLLGESGSGKSTLLQLIQRFYKPTSGGILVNGQLIEAFEYGSYISKIGIVPQEVKIFNNFLLFNIALTDDPKKIEGVIEWCEKYGFDKFFKKFPQGYMTLLGEEGANISGGQKQLVGLARALYRNPDILLIDEGTSAMDRHTENFILDLLLTLKQNMGILMVTHRIKKASKADQIYTLENCTITAQGTPEELMLFENFYSECYNDLILT